jgi:dihydrofolate synthase/folylpolyglutamate synthase
VGVEPTVLVDAAHNPAGAQTLASALRSYFDFDGIAFVVGILRDKDAHGIIDALTPLASRIIVTQSHSDRAAPYDELADQIERWTHESVSSFDDLAEGIEAAREWAALEPRRAVVVTGSITLIGDAMAIADDRGWKSS